MRYPDRARGLVLVDAALGLTVVPSDPPALVRPKWVREILVSLTITNPLATKLLLQSLIAKKERALPEYVEILQRPTALRNSTPDIADWVYYFVGADREAVSADRAAYARLKHPSPSSGAIRIRSRRVEQARDLQDTDPAGDADHYCPGSAIFRRSRTPTAFNDALLKALGKL